MQVNLDGEPVRETLIKQDVLLGRANGIEEDLLIEASKYDKKIYSIAANMQDDDIKSINEMKKLTAEKMKIISNDEMDYTDYAERIVKKRIATPWFRYLLNYDPQINLRNVNCPVLAINGVLDLQVPYKENLEAIQKALLKTKNKDYTIKHFPQLNHLFQTAETGNITEYSNIAETISPLVLKTISRWINERFN